ncbi:MAG: ArsA-related P-loop ATPase, partial [Bdellovibrio sp.]
QLPDTGEVHLVPWPGARGQLWGCVLNSKKVFDEFVAQAAGDPEVAQKLFRNRLYQKLSTSLAGSQEFTALQQLHRLVYSGDYDVVVVDTPPAQHAFEFLSAPRRLASLFQEGVASWFREGDADVSMGLLKKIFQTGTRQVVKVLKLLTGAQFIGELADFFQSLQSWQKQIDQRIQEVQDLLTGPGTEFQLILTADALQKKQSEEMIRRLRADHYRLSRLILNRSTPTWLRESPPEGDPVVEARRREMLDYFQQRELAVREMAGGQMDFLQIPEAELSDLASEVGLLEIAQHLEVAKNPEVILGRGSKGGNL